MTSTGPSATGGEEADAPKKQDISPFEPLSVNRTMKNHEFFLGWQLRLPAVFYGANTTRASPSASGDRTPIALKSFIAQVGSSLSTFGMCKLFWCARRTGVPFLEKKEPKRTFAALCALLYASWMLFFSILPRSGAAK